MSPQEPLRASRTSSKAPKKIQRGSIRSVILGVFRSWGPLKPFSSYLDTLRPPRRLQGASKSLQDAFRGLLGPLGSLFVGILGAKMPQKAPRDAQETPKRLPRGSKIPQEAPKRSQEAPKRPPGAPKRPQRAP